MLSLTNKLMALYRYLLVLNTYKFCFIIKLIRNKVNFNIINNFIKGIKIYINLYIVKYLLYVFYR